MKGLHIEDPPGSTLIGSLRQFKKEQMKQYYTPTIEDIREGYKCEILWNQDIFPEDSWVEVEIGDNSTQDFDRIDWIGRIANSKIRTSYLTKEQLEEEDWEYFDKINNWFRKDGYIVVLFPVQHKIEISTSRLNFAMNTILYSGYCPSINEFRYINNLIKFNR
jgi:hypothetical protein